MKIPVVKQTIKQASLIIAVIAISSQGLGVIREVLVANYLGTSVEYDILLISMAIPMMIANILFVAIPSAGIPFLQNSGGSMTAIGNVSGSRFFRVNILMALIISMIIFITLPLFRGILARNLGEAHIERVIMYGRIFCLFIPIRAYEAIFRSLLQLRHNFLFPALTIFGFNVGTIIVLLTLFPSIGTPAYIAAWLTGAVTQILIVAVPSFILLKNKGSAKEEATRFDSTDYLKYFAVIALIESISLIVEPFDRYLAGTFLADGFVSANHYAAVIGTAPIRILIYAMGTAIFPSLSERVANGQQVEAGRLYHRALVVCLAVMIPIAAYLLMFSDDVVRILFERGKFGIESRLMTCIVLNYYLVGMVFQSLFVIQFKMAFAMKLKRFMIISRLVSYAIKISVGLMFIRMDWALALGGGTAAMYAVSFFLMEYLLIRKSGLSYSSLDLRNVGKAMISSAITVGLMIGSFWLASSLFKFGLLSKFIVVGISGVIGLLFADRWLRITGFWTRLKS
jgi:putative peptidoglycan lipid II flippase